MQTCKLFAVVNARWTTSNQKLLVLEPQWIKSTERAKRLLIPPVYSLRGIRAYDELRIVVTEVGQVKQTVTPPSSTGLRMSAVVPLPSLYTSISWTATVYCYTLSVLTTTRGAPKSCATFTGLHTASCNQCHSHVSRLTRDELATGISLHVPATPAVRNLSVLVSYLEYATQLVHPSKAVRVCH